MVLRKKLSRAWRDAGNLAPFSLIKESGKWQLAWARFFALHLPRETLQQLSLSFPFGARAPGKQLYRSLADASMSLFDELGPIYGKAAQIALTRVSSKARSRADFLGFDRLFGAWNPLPIAAVEAILDQEIPAWRSHLKIEPTPLGVASMAQVHGATGPLGERLVVKVLKPQSEQRLNETAKALKDLLVLLKPVGRTSRTTKKVIADLEELLASIVRESDFLAEKATIHKAHRLLSKDETSKILKIPHTVDHLSSRRVIVMERFDGPRLSEIVSGKVKLPENVRRRLARKILKDLLVQIFEIGLFHGDPHGGNLILLKDGSVGIFDWGLAGELLQSDRKHIAALLRAALSLDREALLDTLIHMTEMEGRPVEREKLTKIVQKLAKNFKDDDAKPSLRRFLQLTLATADEAHIAIPSGLLLMAKSLITIEGIAKGLDPDVMLLRVAAPVLFQAARPSLQDLFKMATRLPAFFRKGKPD